ncbi:ArdC family protein [Neolewinella persica]|uniref:ArdC family protein n=1 Tax=Neolewinella persica TaxID=70998 RepID=UPI00036A44AF|nr:zincin-like metallopeptidase domain-containing protein [Neolewinella persica]
MQRTTRVKPDLYQVVTNKLIALLESGVAPWQRAWNQYGLASNYSNGHTYTGINAFLLNFLPAFDIPLYMTYKQAQAMGGQVRKGAKAEPVYFFKTLYKDADGKSIKPERVADRQAAGDDVHTIPMPRSFYLFNVADIDGIDFKIPEISDKPSRPIQRCDDFVATFQGMPEVLHEDLNSAHYVPKKDRINMPPLPRFHSPEAYYKTLFHEMIHATGSAGRLNRPGITLPGKERKAGSAPHALEELIAELGAAYLCQIAGINSQPLQENSAAYLEGYLGHLRKDKKFLFQAATSAQRAVDFLLKPRVEAVTIAG